LRAAVSALPRTRFGNFGPDDPNYEKADVKIMAVGSSFNLVGDEKGRLSLDLAAEQLSRRTGRRVSILNFSRDATGLLAHMDIARAKIDELKPHVLLVLANARSSFISAIGAQFCRRGMGSVVSISHSTPRKNRQIPCVQSCSRSSSPTRSPRRGATK
jgi:hypothetical protein